MILNTLKSILLTVSGILICISLGIGAVFGWKQWVRAQSESGTPGVTLQKTTLTPSPTPYQFSPPTGSMSGRIATASGSLAMIGRDSETGEEHAASEGAALVQGDAVITREGSRAILTFGSEITLAMMEESRLGLINLIPRQSILFRQTAGKVWYRSVNEAFPLTVRTFHLLVHMPKGIVVVENAEVGIVVTAVSGDIKLAYIDTDNNTQTVLLKEGAYAVFNDTMRTIVTGESQAGLRFPGEDQ